MSNGFWQPMRMVIALWIGVMKASESARDWICEGLICVKKIYEVFLSFVCAAVSHLMSGTLEPNRNDLMRQHRWNKSTLKEHNLTEPYLEGHNYRLPTSTKRNYRVEILQERNYKVLILALQIYGELC